MHRLFSDGKCRVSLPCTSISMSVLFLYTFEDLVLLPSLRIDRMFDQRDEFRQNCRDYEVHDRSDDQREECLICAASDEIAYLGEIQYRDIADD